MLKRKTKKMLRKAIEFYKRDKNIKRLHPTTLRNRYEREKNSNSTTALIFS